MVDPYYYPGLSMEPEPGGSFLSRLGSPAMTEMLMGLSAGLLSGAEPGGTLAGGMARGLHLGTQAMGQARQRERDEKRAQLYDKKFQLESERAEAEKAERQRRRDELQKLLPTLPPELQKIAAFDPDGFMRTYSERTIQTAMPDPTKPPDLETMYDGGMQYQARWDPQAGGFVEVPGTRAPRWQPQQVQESGSTAAVRTREAKIADVMSTYGVDRKQALEMLGEVETSTPGGGVFEGSALDAQALNLLVQQGRMTPEQAAQYATGKFATGPNGELNFVMPSGVFPTPEALAAPDQGTPAAEQSQRMVTIRPGTPPPPTQAELSAATFRDRLVESDKLISGLTEAGTSKVQEAAGYVPFVSNYLKSDERQRFEQAQRNFINAQLRRESGAVISEEEFANARQQYFPQPGDSPEVLEQKAQNRRTAIEGIKRETAKVPLPTSSQGTAPVRISGDADYNALPSGTQFIAPDGSVRVKP